MKPASTYLTDTDRWHAVQARDAAACGHFVYAVRTTGVYCQPGCKSRLAKRENVEFFADSGLPRRPVIVLADAAPRPRPSRLRDALSWLLVPVA